MADEDVPNEPTDTELIGRFLGGDEGAFNQLALRHRAGIYRLALSVVSNPEDAEDITQEVLMKIYRKMNQFEKESRFTTWLYRIAVNQCHDFHRKKRGLFTKLVPTAQEDEDPLARLPDKSQREPDAAASREELATALQKALAQLKEKHRNAFVLREVQGLSCREVAEILNCSEGTVMSRLFYARQKLRVLLRSLLGPEFEADLNGADS